jgi:hypothetical protein
MLAWIGMGWLIGLYIIDHGLHSQSIWCSGSEAGVNNFYFKSKQSYSQFLTWSQHWWSWIQFVKHWIIVTLVFVKSIFDIVTLNTQISFRFVPLKCSKVVILLLCNSLLFMIIFSILLSKLCNRIKTYPCSKTSNNVPIYFAFWKHLFCIYMYMYTVYTHVYVCIYTVLASFQLLAL